jgi:uncharacterized protein YjbJ (UPF0337 family)
MNEDIIQGNWKELKGKVQKTWGKLTDNDITQMKGSYEELQGKLQATYGYKSDQAKKEIDNFIKNNNLKDKN